MSWASITQIDRRIADHKAIVDAHHTPGGGNGGAPHASTHEDAGEDEINVAGLSGELVDNQPPKAHTHIENDITDLLHTPESHTHLEADITDLAHTTELDHDTEIINVSKDDHHNEDHASRHEPAGADVMTVDAVAATGSLRTLGTGAQQAAVGNHGHAGGGADVKSGKILVPDNTWTDVTFNTAFINTPHVVVTMEDEITVIENLCIWQVNKTGFKVHQEVKTGPGDRWIHWIATDAGNP